MMKAGFGLIEGSATIFEVLLLLKKLRTSLRVVENKQTLGSISPNLLVLGGIFFGLEQRG